ncbi:hypothetical protein DF020_01955 [Burkholderia cenocepacia]|uniref:hypothetical protein n=1 Tax=Burkholderia cenocepacia TaxID=95486 RepID=UPI000F5A5359|nr:hypothetical protein [Burkholderia cenocepacia]MBR8507143.1 hypothetical protein [Burkholderia cenocepacia]RQV63577.1 hypothetical protein DF020_01955 [Burkholderia cenocepacia]
MIASTGMLACPYVCRRPPAICLLRLFRPGLPRVPPQRVPPRIPLRKRDAGTTLPPQDAAAQPGK